MLDKDYIDALKRYQARQKAESASAECWELVSYDAKTGECVFHVKKPKAPKPKKIAISVSPAAAGEAVSTPRDGR